MLTRLSVKTVNNTIDKKAVFAIAGSRDRHATQLLNRHALMALALERRLTDQLVPDLPRAVRNVSTTLRHRVWQFKLAHSALIEWVRPPGGPAASVRLSFSAWAD